MWKRHSKHDNRVIGKRTWVILLAVCSACGYPPLEPLCGGLICGSGQACAANQPVCISIGGCGNGIIDNGEVCDDGNVVDGELINGIFVADQCNHNCTSTQECGNGIQDVGEACDHGKPNGAAGDTCDIHCQFVCGNGIIDQNAGEQCDPGNMDSAGCNSNQADRVKQGLGCKAPKCGDGYTNMAAGERCDSSSIDTAQCNGSFCTLPICGDSFVNTAAGEECDSGGIDTIICNGNSAGTVSCKISVCGDGYVNKKFSPMAAARTEECDMGVPCTDTTKTCTNCNCI